MADESKNITQNGDVAPPKTAKQLEKEAKKQAKLDKLKQKLEKQQNTAPKKDAEVSGYAFHCSTYVPQLYFIRKKRKRKR